MEYRKLTIERIIPNKISDEERNRLINEDYTFEGTNFFGEPIFDKIIKKENSEGFANEYSRQALE